MAITLAEAAKFFQQGTPPKDYFGDSFRRIPKEPWHWDYSGMPDCTAVAEFELFSQWRCVLKFHTGGHVYERLS